MLPQPSSYWHSLFFCVLWLFHHFPINAVHGEDAEAHRGLLLMELIPGDFAPDKNGGSGALAGAWGIFRHSEDNII